MKELGGIYIIATIVEPHAHGKGWKDLGYKVMNYPACNLKLLSDESLLNLCKSEKIEIKNAVFKDGKLVGTQGSLDRYTKLNALDGKSLNGNRFVILGKDSDGNYIVVQDPEHCDGKQYVKTMSEGSLLHFIGNSPLPKGKVFIANGKLKAVNEMQIQRTFMENYIISPIKGTYDVIKECPKFTEKVFDLKATQKELTPTWKVRIIQKGEKYGLDYCRTNTGKELVEFYDMTANKKNFPIGQFVASYYLETLSDKGKHSGLCLYGDVPTWTLTKESYDIVLDWLNHIKGVKE